MNENIAVGMRIENVHRHGEIFAQCGVALGHDDHCPQTGEIFLDKLDLSRIQKKF